jgi:hypothetical protein
MLHRFFFFAGGDHREGEGNVFTANFIHYLSDILGARFSLIKGIYHSGTLLNVIWALNHAQKPKKYPERNRIIFSSVNQILSDPLTAHSAVTLVSSSYGSVVAAQAACYLAQRQLHENILNQPFNLALGASMVSKRSDLYAKLLLYQKNGIIGTIIYDELQDAGDNSIGIGGSTRFEGFANGLGICFPFLTLKYERPSFLNADPVSGHVHRVRSQSLQKSKDFLRIILIDYRLGGDESKIKADKMLM